MKPEGKFSLVDLSLLGAVLIWSLNFTVIKASLEAVGPHTFNALRFIMAALFIWYIIWRRKEWVSVKKEHYIPLIGLGLLGNMIYQWLFIIGIDHTYAANAAIMLGTIPIWIALVAHLFTKEKLSLQRGGGVLLGFIGIFVIMWGGEDPISLGTDSFVGDLLIIFSALVFGFYTVYSRPYIASYSPLQFSGMMIAIGAISLNIYAIPEMISTDWSEITPAAWGGMLYSGTFAISVAYMIWNTGLVKVGTVRTAAYQNLVPVLGLVFGVVLLSESLNLWQYIGSALTLAGIAMARRS